MALITADRVRNYADVSGTGTISVGRAAVGHKSLLDVLNNGDTFYYSITNEDNGEWETGLATFSAPNTVIRTAVSQSSNADAIVNFTVGRKFLALSFNSANYDILAHKQNLSGYFTHQNEEEYGPYSFDTNAPFPSTSLPASLENDYSPIYTGAPIIGFTANGTYGGSQQTVGVQVDANAFLFSDSEYNTTFVVSDSYYGEVDISAVSKPPYYSLGSCRVTYGGVEITGYLHSSNPVPITGDNNFYNTQVPNWLYMNKRISKSFYKETDTTSYNLDYGDTDDGRTIIFSSNSPVTINIGDVSSSLSCRIIQYGTGQITFVANNSGYRTVNLISKNGLKSNGQYSVIEVNLIRSQFTEVPFMFTYTLILTGDLTS